MSKEEKELKTAEAVEDKKEKKEKKEKKPLNKRKLKYGALATTVTVVFVAIVVMLNVVAKLLTERYPIKLDLTDEAIFEISNETIDYLKTLDKDVEIAVLDDKATLEGANNIYTKQIVEIVEKYGMHSDKIKINFIDTEKDPTYVAKFKEKYSNQISSGQIVVAGDKRAKVFGAMDLYETEMDYSTYQENIIGCKAEEVLTSAVMNVTDENPKNIAIITTTASQSAAGLESVKALMESNGFIVSDVDILTSEIPDETDLIFVMAPYNDFTDSQIEKLDKFLNNDGELGKSMFYAANFDQGETPKLDAFLEEWGVELNKGYLYYTDDASAQQVGISGMGNYFKVLMTSITDTSTYGSLLTNSTLPMVMPFSRPVVINSNTSSSISTASLLQVDGTAALVPLELTEGFTPTALGEPTDVMTISTKEAGEKSSKLVTLGSALFLDPVILGEKNYGNGELFVNTLNLLTNKESLGLTIQPKNMKMETLTLREVDVKRTRALVLMIIPLTVVFIGTVVFFRRRNR